MSRKSFWIFFIGAIVIAAMASSDVCAQGRGGRGGRGRGFGGPGFGGGPGGGFNVMGLLGVEEVRAEIELTDDQQDDIRKAADEARENRPPRGERPNFQDMSDEEREQFFAEMRERAEKRAKEDKEKLADILMLPQLERLGQIALQIQGVGALANAEVAEKIGLDDKQVKTIQTEIQEAANGMRDKIREMFTGGDREGMREKIESLRKEIDEQVLAKLTDEQRKQFEELKGEPFEMPEGMRRRRGRGGPGGAGGPGGRGRGGRDGGGRQGGGNRPQRPSGDET
jgi:hypothetical protein